MTYLLSAWHPAQSINLLAMVFYFIISFCYNLLQMIPNFKKRDGFSPYAAEDYTPEWHLRRQRIASMVRWRPSSADFLSYPHMVEGTRNLSEDSFIKALTPFVRVLLSQPNQLSQAPPAIMFEVRISTYAFLWGHKHPDQTRHVHFSLNKTVVDSNHVKLCGNYRSIRHGPCLKIVAIFSEKGHSHRKQDHNKLRRSENLIAFYKLPRGRSTRARISPFHVSEATEIFLPNGLTLPDLSWFGKIDRILIERTEQEGHSGQGE